MLPSPDPRTATMHEYVVVFEDNQPPKQTEMTALSDEHAVQLLKKEYSTVGWSLYRAGNAAPVFHFAPSDSVS